jgi:HEAT repeat protein
MDYAEAVQQLASPRTWCDGAETLAQIGDSQALVPLLQAYEMRVEASRGCLLDALAALDPVSGALDLAASEDPETRRLGVHLMELFPDERYLPTLEQVLHQESGRLHRQALRSLITQYQTPDWEAVLIRLLDSGDDDVRAKVIESLARRRTDTAQQALRHHFPRETNPDLQDKIQQSLD